VKILSIVGARPNFMKIAPLHRAFQRYPDIQSVLVHTGQHYDAAMSQVFFEQLELPTPHHYLGIGGGSHTQQTARTMLAFEEVVLKEQPDLVLVVGDVNASIACALVAVKMGIPVAHVEAGLRSGDKRMPEEINRILTDAISDLLFVTEKSGLEHLDREGVAADKIHFTGNCMIDSLLYCQEKVAAPPILETLQLSPKKYVLVTMHRPSNVDTHAGLVAILAMMEGIAPMAPIVFPVHPRTRARFSELNLKHRLESISQLQILEPQGYVEFQQLMAQAAAVLTDSGGVQEETTYLKVPCLTFREHTERPITIEIGTNELIPSLNPDLVREKVEAILAGKWKQGSIPELWDGHAAERIAAVIHSTLKNLCALCLYVSMY
jgi:UDP-N-acetylglucosamine 2-epimerase (non-hydrolysing)